jgi:hypothetical protein
MATLKPQAPQEPQATQTAEPQATPDATPKDVMARAHALVGSHGKVVYCNPHGLGVYVAPIGRVLAATRAPPCVIRDGADPPLAVMEARHFGRLLLKGNPDVLAALFTPGAHTPEWRGIAQHRAEFVTAMAVRQCVAWGRCRLRRGAVQSAVKYLLMARAMAAGLPPVDPLASWDAQASEDPQGLLDDIDAAQPWPLPAGSDAPSQAAARINAWLQSVYVRQLFEYDEDEE